jgi:hypothetical protein
MGNHKEYHNKIYIRDKWKCQMPECLCPDGRNINPDLRGVNDPWAPSIDHVNQRSTGGKDHQHNMRAAHRYCNEQDARFTFHGEYGEQEPLTATLGELFPDLTALQVDNPVE